CPRAAPALHATSSQSDRQADPPVARVLSLVPWSNLRVPWGVDVTCRASGRRHSQFAGCQGPSSGVPGPWQAPLQCVTRVERRRPHATYRRLATNVMLSYVNRPSQYPDRAEVRPSPGAAPAGAEPLLSRPPANSPQASFFRGAGPSPAPAIARFRARVLRSRLPCRL